MPGARVVVVGSINADLVVSVERLPAPGETVSGGRFARHGGGKGANQAVAAARLGADVTIVGAVGADDLGDEALRELRAEGVDVTHVARLDGVPTGVALIAVDASGENQISVASGANAELTGEAVAASLTTLLADRAAGDPEDPGPAAPTDPTPAPTDPSPAMPTDPSPAAPTDLTPAASSDPGPAASAGAASRGVVLLGHEVPDVAVVAGAEAAAAAGWMVVLNPAPARPLSQRALAAAPLLTPNAAEAAQLTGEHDPAAAARALRERSGAAVLVTLGADGALLLDVELERLPAPRVEVVDTTGAGDTVNGALAAELSAGRPLREAARFALAAAALSTRSAGAREGMPRREELA